MGGVAWLPPSLLLVAGCACFARTPDERLQVRHLEAVHEQRIEWAKKRAPVMPVAGVYRDFRAVYAPRGDFPLPQILKAAKDSDVQVVLGSAPGAGGVRDGILVLDGVSDPGRPADADSVAITPKQRRGLEGKFKQYPDEVFGVPGAGQALLENLQGAAHGASHDSAHLRGSRGGPELGAKFRSSSMHVLARELTESSIRAGLADKRSYIAEDWLCDPAGFLFFAENFFGVFDIGDDVPMLNTRIEARLPIAASIKLLRNGSVVAEASGSRFQYDVKDAGAYRLQAWLKVDGEDLLWIETGAMKVNGVPDLALPPVQISPNVEVRKDISYTGGDPADASKHKLDLYLPKGKKNFPVMVFLHGGSWRTGDRSLYPVLGNRFAKAGIGVAIPSYRLMPGNPHPAQAEDCAAAFAWIFKNIAQYGGDIRRIYLVGHSSGGHVAALLALDQTYLKPFDVPVTAIHGVATFSGVYDVSHVPEFISQTRAPDPSPIAIVHANAPPFLIAYCQWDYFELPKQARDFAAALKQDFVAAQLVYLPGENHISELLNIWKDDDPIAQAIVSFVK
jgi:acetyl esterase/lipase